MLKPVSTCSGFIFYFQFGSRYVFRNFSIQSVELLYLLLSNIYQNQYYQSVFCATLRIVQFLQIFTFHTSEQRKKACSQFLFIGKARGRVLVLISRENESVVCEVCYTNVNRLKTIRILTFVFAKERGGCLIIQSSVLVEVTFIIILENLF